jgi:hypothetical protein
MSIVFHGLAVRGSARAALRRLKDVETELRFSGWQATSRLAILHPEVSREDIDPVDLFDELEIVAALLSARCSGVLIVQIDTRVGQRYCVYYRDGDPVEAFGLDQELYVPLDDRGEPDWSAPKVAYGDLDPDPKAEYATAVYAIDLGLKRLGTGTWEAVLRCIEEHL